MNMKNRHLFFIILLSWTVFMGCQKKQQLIIQKAPVPYVQAQLAKLAPVDMRYDISNLSEADRACLAKLVEAAHYIDQLYLLQVNPDNPALLSELQQSKDTADQPYLDLFNVMFGPWNRIDEYKPFLNTMPKPQGAGYYPLDMSKEEFEKTIKDQPRLAKDFTGNFTAILREQGKLRAVPYHQAYQPLPEKVSVLLKEAAALTQDTTLKKFLNLRADAFLTDDYFESDMAWMDLAGDLEVVIGPYEVYEDNLFNYKAAYEAFICVVDKEESGKLAAAAAYLDEMEASLPIPDQYRNMRRGSSSPIKVVQEIFTAGDAKCGVQTTAFNLPNDERVREAKGSKKVMLKNIAQAKYEKCWIPIVDSVLAPKPRRSVSFDSYFSHVLMHEISHGLGPGTIMMPDSSRVDVSKALKEHYTVLEECKADVLGILTMKFLMGKGVFSKKNEYAMYASYLGGMLRSIRFGIKEAHGGGVAMQFNYCFEKGAFKTDSDGRLDFNQDKMIPTLTELVSRILLIQAKGDYEGAKQLIAQYRVTSPLMQRCVDKLKDVPIDIRPRFPSLEK